MTKYILNNKEMIYATQSAFIIDIVGKVSISVILIPRYRAGHFGLTSSGPHIDR